MEPHVMQMGDLDVHVTVSDRRRTVRLTVERDATLTVTVPPETSEAVLAKAIAAKRPWVYAKLRERAETGTLSSPREFVTGEGFPYLGRSYRLLLVGEAERPVRLNRGRLELRRDCAGGSTNDATRHLVRWYRQVGESWLRKRIKPWALRMEVDVAGPQVLPLGYRWGSCTAQGKLNIHWATMQLSPDLVDYVLVHELAHVRHPRHDENFWRAVERPMPDFAARRTRLRLAGPALWLPDAESSLYPGSAVRIWDGDPQGQRALRCSQESRNPRNSDWWPTRAMTAALLRAGYYVEEYRGHGAACSGPSGVCRAASRVPPGLSP